MGGQPKQTGNGTYTEYPGVRGPDTRTKWQAFKDGIYNPTDGTFLGRDKKRWGIFGLFYLVFYSVLAVLISVCFMCLMATIDEKQPTYLLEASLIGTNPGLGYRPMDVVEKGPIISYTSSNSSHVAMWTSRVNSFLEKYLDKTKLLNSGRDQVICDYERPAPADKVCAVDVTGWGPCTAGQSYGFNNSAPCVFVKLNRIYGWVPEYYNDPKNLPDTMPQDLKEHINQIDKSKLNTVWVSCNGERADDQENIGKLSYYPSYRGFPGFYYPYLNSPEYLSPVVAVQLLRPKRNVTINIECRAWAKNIVYSSHRGEKTGAVHFELMIKE